MSLTAHISRYKTQLLDGCFAIAILLFSFPNYEPDFNTGLDAPFRWAYNYLFAFDYEQLLSLRYTYGPLAFLKVPVAIHHNFIIALVTFNLLKAVLVFKLLQLGKQYIKFIAYPVVFALGYFVSIDQAIIGIVAVGCINYFDNKNILNYIIAMLAALLGFYIKPQIGINSFAMIFVLFALVTIQEKNFRLSLRLVVLSLVFIISSSALVGHSVFYFFQFLYASLKITSEYSSSLSLHPENNWMLLSLYILSVLAIPFVLKKKYLNRYFMLFPVFFFTWKYGVVREEFLYYVRMLDSVVLICVLLILSTEFKKIYWYVLPILALVFIFSNLNFIKVEDKEYHKTLLGFDHFSKAALNHDELVKESIHISAKNIYANRLPKVIREEISDHSIDFFPWDVSYAAANNLNWQSRSSFQSIGISGWVDDAYAQDFTLENGPAYVLFHYVNDTMGGQLGGVDYRYLLNFSPHTTTALMNNYFIVHASEKWALFKQTPHPNLESSETIKSENITWDQWYDCPSSDIGVLKLYLAMDYTFIGKLAQFVYKDNQYTIDLELENGTIKTYRFIPSVAKNGLWVNPHLTGFNSEQPAQIVKRIRISTANKMFRNCNFVGNWTLQKPTKENKHTFLK